MSNPSEDWYAKGRRWAKEHDSLSALLSSVKEWSGRLVTTRWANAKASVGGSAAAPGTGQRWEGTLAEHASALADLAATTATKTKAPTYAHGTSESLGSSDVECMSRTAIFLDCDKDSTGAGWDLIRQVFDAVGVGYVAQRRNEKFHIEIPIAISIILEPGGSFKPHWQRQFGWVLGVLSQLAFPDGDGDFDPKTDRLLQLIFAYTRKKKDDPIPETVLGQGKLALDWDAFLDATRFPDKEAEAEIEACPTARASDSGRVEAGPEAVAEARTLLQRLPASIEGKGGDKALWMATLHSVVGFNLSTTQAKELLLEVFNPRCEPAWDEYVIDHKLRDAERNKAGLDWGYLLTSRRNAATLERAWGTNNCEETAINKTIIQLRPDVSAVANDVEAALSGGNSGLYQRAGLLVRIVDIKRPKDEERKQGDIYSPNGAPTILPVTIHNLIDLAAQRCRFVRRNTDGDLIEKELPEMIAKIISDRGSWNLPVLSSVSEVPFLRVDGSIMQVSGLDEQTGVYYRPFVDYPTVPDEPTKEDACVALGLLKEVLSDFPFVEEHHRSAALSAILTVAAGPAIQGPRPMFEFGAHTPGDGKSLLADVISMIGSGRAPATMSQPTDEEEARKLVLSLALAGTRVILIDNATGLVGTPSMAMALTSCEVQGRLLGMSKVASVPISATWLITGNGLSYTADLGRRIVPVTLDAGVEHPEDRIGWKIADLRGHILKERPQLVTAALTILRAHSVAGRPLHGDPKKGSFERWDDIVRSALIWLDQPDPIKGVTALREESDYDREIIEQFMNAWGESKPMTAAQMVEGGGFNGSLRAAISAFCGSLDARELGIKLRCVSGRIVGGRRIIREKKSKTGVIWKIEKILN